MIDDDEDDALPNHRLLMLPDAAAGVPSIRAKALLFHDPRSVELLRQVERIARSEATLLVVGETGTGKELIARHLHTQSGRRGPFLAVNCGAFSETMIDAELFGHESGAYTGATQARAGWFEAANGGTLFLDEIGDLPLGLQVKLLRVLQERQVVRLGSRRAIAIDVRLVAATNIDLGQAVAARHFRADLYWRLSVAPLALPPLRERRGDILPLARHFISVYGPRLGLANARLQPETEQALLGYAWPGNIRELENVIHFALIVSTQGVVRPQDLKLVSGVAEAAGSTPLQLPSAPSWPAGESPARRDAEADLGDAIERLLGDRRPGLYRCVEEALLRAAFAQSRENQVQAARLLGVTRNTLRTLLKRYGMLADAPSRNGDGALAQPMTH